LKPDEKFLEASAPRADEPDGELMTAIRRAVERYLARGTDGLTPAHATALRRLNSWMLLINILMPLIIVQQLLGPQRRTAVVNIAFWLVTIGCRGWALRQRRHRVARVLRAHDGILIATVVDLVVTALLNGGIQAAGLWYLLLIPITVGHMRDVRKTIGWTAVCVAAVGVVAVLDPVWPFPRDLRLETLGVVVSMRVMLLAAVSAFVVASAKAMRRHVAAIEERESLLTRQARELALARDEAEAAHAHAERTIAALLAAEQELRTKNAELDAKNAELDGFVYSVSHDLKAPLVAVQGFTDILVEDYGARFDDQGRHFLARVQANVQQMERLIHDLLALSRIGRDARAPEPVSLAEVVDEFEAEMAPALRERAITVRRHDLGALWGVRTEIEQVVRNLLGNAVKYLGDTRAPVVEIGMREDGAEVECYVKDNGIGIDPLYHDKVFEIFQRLREVEAEGTGVGLAIVKKIVTRAGGRVWVESLKGQGATFRVRWPAHPAGARPLKSAGPEAESRVEERAVDATTTGRRRA
jgi:signal transduction histidine kinase